MPTDIVQLLIQYPETCCLPDILAVPVTEGYTKENIIDVFRKNVRLKELEAQKEYTDRLTILDLIIADMGLELNTKITAHSIDAVFEIM